MPCRGVERKIKKIEKNLKMCIKYADNNCSFLNYKVVLQKNYYSKPFLFFML